MIAPSRASAASLHSPGVCPSFPCTGRVRIEAVAVQLAPLMLRNPSRRYLWTHERQGRKEWRQVLRTAGRLFIPDEEMDRAERRQCDPWELADELGVTVRLLLVRAKEWFQQAGRVVSFEIRRSVDEAVFAWAGGEGW